MTALQTKKEWSVNKEKIKSYENFVKMHLNWQTNEDDYAKRCRSVLNSAVTGLY